MQLVVMMSTMSLVICLYFLFCIEQWGGLAAALTARNDVLEGGNQITCDVEGESVFIPNIPNMKCFNCTCRDGFVKCVLPKCAPIENCHDHEVLQNDECCPKCKGTGSHLNPSSGALAGACSRGASVYKAGSHFNLDDCTRCSCNNSKIQCKKKSCPMLNCSRGEQRTLPGQCCPQCDSDANQEVTIKPIVRPDKEEANEETELLKFTKKKQQSLRRQPCVYTDKTYGNGESWNTTTCKTCICIQGRIDCSKIMCPALKCPVNSIKKVPDGVCCPVCEKQLNRVFQGGRSVCTIIDGLRFYTFDLKIFAITGASKYQLVSDCEGEPSSFNVKLETTVLRNSTQFKRISLKLGTTRIDLQKSREAKVNDRIVDLPYRHEWNQLQIEGNDEEVKVTTATGVKVRWSYLGFLEITMPEKYREKVCGLCGNFNGLADDDLTTREGILVDDPEIFAQSWASGKEKWLDTREYGIRRRKPEKDQRMCSNMKSSVFEKCLKTILATSYYEICLRDCSSDNLQCHCKSFAKYARDCRKLKMNITRWRKYFGC